ncbi:hypothetical protein [Larkinella soli]|uniref:hypothetical protein n=1 Tax=Larkinella soli TaxID=1770527 RepID=UPI0019D07DDC|nr:hypothetical protein [Larkinella soli]
MKKGQVAANPTHCPKRREELGTFNLSPACSWFQFIRHKAMGMGLTKSKVRGLKVRRLYIEIKPGKSRDAKSAEWQQKTSGDKSRFIFVILPDANRLCN